MTQQFARSCGTCQECCFHTPVLPLGKPANTRCPHQCADGCAVYEYRPSACSTYRCSWLAGELPEWAKPNECGLLFESSYLTLNGGKRFVMLVGWMTDYDKAKTFEHRMDELLQHANVVIVADCPVAVYGDETLVLVRDDRSADVFRAIQQNIADGKMQFQFADQLLTLE